MAKTRMELAMGRRPRDPMDTASMNREQLTSTPTKQDLLDEEIQKLVMKTHIVMVNVPWIGGDNESAG